MGWGYFTANSSVSEDVFCMLCLQYRVVWPSWWVRVFMVLPGCKVNFPDGTIKLIFNSQEILSKSYGEIGAFKRN